MSHPHHPDPSKENADTHPVRLAIGIAVGAFALIVGIILLTQFAVSAYGNRSLKNDPSMSAEAVAKRIAPVAKVTIDPNAPVPVAAAVAPGAAPAAAPTPVAAAGGDGKAVYDKTCTACHSTGAAGAPKAGDKAAWAPRIAGGKDHLYQDAIKGKGAMPPKGGNPALSDAEVKAAVDYILSTVK
jgi:cytochrome c5